MNRALKTIIVAALAVCAGATAAQADIKLRIKNTEDARSGESVVHIKGRRQRNEFSGKRPDGTIAGYAVIYQCDLNRALILDHTKRVFYEHPHFGLQEFMARAEARNAQQTQKSRALKTDGRVVETFTVVDTGERKEIFGYTARRIKTTLTWVADSPQDCPRAPLLKETDGWYVDLLYGTYCSYDISGFDESELRTPPQSKCVDHFFGDNKRKYQFERRQVGTARFGFPVLLQVKSYGDDNRPLLRTSEVVEITNGELDASLFEPPIDFTKFTEKKRSLASRALSLFGKR